MSRMDGSAARRLRVLVADDNGDSANSLGSLAQMWGHEVRFVHGGIDALAIEAVFGPDVMLLDLAMPGMDGNQLARKIRQLAGATILLIAITGDLMEADYQTAVAAGINYILSKPTNLYILESLLSGARNRLKSISRDHPGDAAVGDSHAS